MAYTSQVKAAIAADSGQPIGYVFMVAMQPRGPMRATKAEAVADAVNAKEARVDVQYGRVFYDPLTWIAPIYP